MVVTAKNKNVFVTSIITTVLVTIVLIVPTIVFVSIMRKK